MAMTIISCNSIAKEKELQINQKYFATTSEEMLLKVCLRNYLYDIKISNDIIMLHIFSNANYK